MNQGEATGGTVVSSFSWTCEHCGRRVTEETAVLLEHDGHRMTSCIYCTPPDD